MIKFLKKKLNEAGKIKIGRKGKSTTSSGGNDFRLPEKLDHFRITTTERDESGDMVDDVALMTALKAEGSGAVLNGDGNIIGIPIRLIYNDTELNFPNRLASYNKGILVCHGDGETSFNRIDDFQKPKKCPCDKFDATYTGNDKCKVNGKLTCVIDAAGMFGQVHVFRTTSMNSVEGIIGGIELIKAATNGRIVGLPLMLTLNAKNTTVPSTGAQTKVFIVSVCYRGSMSDLQNKCLQIATDHAQFLLSMDKIEKETKASGNNAVVDDDQEFQEEFYPESIIAAGGDDAGENAVQKEGAGDDSGNGSGEIIDTTATVISEERAVEQVQKKTSWAETLYNPEDTINNANLVDFANFKIHTPDPKKLDLLNRLKAEREPSKAWKLVPRLDKDYLIQYLIEMDAVPLNNPTIKDNKPVFVDHIISYIGSAAWKSKMGGVSRETSPGPEEKMEGSKPTEQTETAKEHAFITELKAIGQQYLIVKAMRERFNTVINGTLTIEDLLILAQKLLDSESAGAGAEKTEDSEQKEIPGVCENSPEEDGDLDGDGLEDEETTDGDAGSSGDDVKEDSKDDGKTEYKDPYAYDNSNGPAIEKQFIEMAHIKKNRKIADADWFEMVSKYKNSDGAPYNKATQMSFNQAQHFLDVLNGKEPPF